MLTLPSITNLAAQKYLSANVYDRVKIITHVIFQWMTYSDFTQGKRRLE